MSITIVTMGCSPLGVRIIGLGVPEGGEDAPVIVIDDDKIGAIRFEAYDGAAYDQSAEIESRIDGTPGASGDLPGLLEFKTRSDGTSGTLQTRMTLRSDGDIGIATTSPTERLVVLGNLSINHSAGTSTTFFVDTTSQRVGIGTTNPGTLLTVAGNVNVSGSLNVTGNITFPQLISCDTINTDANGVLTCGSDATSAGAEVTGSGNAGNITYWTASSTLGNSTLYQSSGKIGIGTISPNAELEVIGTVSVVGEIDQKNGSFAQIPNPIHKGTNGVSGPRHVFVSGKYAYVTENAGDRLAIIDVSDPSNPIDVSSISDTACDAANAGGCELDGAYAIFVSGKYAYVASNTDDGIEILDVSDPFNPVHVAKFNDSDDPDAELNGAAGIFVSGKYAYIASTADNGVEILDISDPTNPTHVGSITDSGATELAGAQGIFVTGKYAYIASSIDDGVEILDISDPTNPTHAGSIDDDTCDAFVGDEGCELDGAIGIYVSGKYAYVVSSIDDGMEILDISNVSNITHVAKFNDSDHPDAELDGATDIFVSGKYAYITGQQDDGLEIIDISDPTNPVHVTKFNDSDHASAELNGAWGIYISGKYAYIVSSVDNGMEVLDIGGLDAPAAHIGSIEASTILVTENMDIGNNLQVHNGLTVGPGGILSNGDVGITGELTVGDNFYVNRTANNTVFFVNATSGKVGIGTSSPDGLLEVKGSVGSVIITDTGNSLTFTRDGTSYLLFSSSNGKLSIGEGISSSQRFLDITGTGTVGIGDGEPDALLEISTSAGSLDLFMLSANDSNDGDLFIVKNSGNVGIGTTNPGTLLTIAGNVNVSGSLNVTGNITFPQLISCDTINTDANGVLTCGSDADSGSAGAPAGAGNSGNITYWTGSGTIGNSTLFQSGGRIGIGTVNPGVQLQVIGNINASGSINATAVHVEGTVTADDYLCETAGCIGTTEVAGLVSADISGLADVDLGGGGDDDFGDFSCTGSGDGCTLDSGTVATSELATDAVAVADLDDGSATASNDDVVMIDNADNTQFIYIDVPDCDDGNGHLNYDTTSQAFTCGTTDAGAGGATGAGNSGNITYWTGSGTVGNSTLFQSGGNIGIGTTSPTANLHIIDSSPGGAFRIQNASLNTIFFVNGSNGRVGIGTTTPEGTLEVATSGDGATEDTILRIKSGLTGVGSSASSILSLDEVSNPGRYGFDIEYSGVMNRLYFTGLNAGVATQHMTIMRASGFVGLNDSAPDARLEINAYGGAGLMISSTDSGDGDLLIVDSSGNLGLGTISPGSTLTVIGDVNITGSLNISGNITFPQLISCDTINTDANGVLTCGSDATSAGAEVTGSGNAGNITYWTGSSTLGNSTLFQSGGFIGIGTTTPSSELHVVGRVNVSSLVANQVLFVNGSVVGIGTSSPETDFAILTIAGNNTDVYHYSYNGVFTTWGPDYRFRRARGGEDAPVIVIDDDKIGAIRFEAYDGASYDQSAEIESRIDGTPGASGDLPGLLEFKTRSDGTSGSLQTRMTLRSDGDIGIATTSPTERLVVLGNLSINHSAGTSTTFFVDTTSQRVGIGTTTPSHILSVYKSDGTTTPSKSNTASLEIWNPSGGLGDGGQILFRTDNGTENTAAAISFYNQDSTASGTKGDLQFSTKSSTGTDTLTPRLTIQWDGNVGIGTTSPSDPLTIYGNSSAGDNTTVRISLGDDTGAAGEYAQLIFTGRSASNDYGTAIRHINTQSTPSFLNPRLAFLVQDTSTNELTNMTEKMTILGSGNVGIGTASPAHPLDVVGTIRAGASSDTTIDDDIYFNSANKFIGRGSTQSRIQFGTDVVIDSDGNIDFDGGDDGTDMRLTSGGNVGIGTTTPSSTLTVTGNITTSQTNNTLGSFNVFQYNSTCSGFRFGTTGAMILSCA